MRIYNVYYDVVSMVNPSTPTTKTLPILLGEESRGVGLKYLHPAPRVPPLFANSGGFILVNFGSILVCFAKKRYNEASIQKQSK
jgi:hypothetical protein